MAKILKIKPATPLRNWTDEEFIEASKLLTTLSFTEKIDFIFNYYAGRNLNINALFQQVYRDVNGVRYFFGIKLKTTDDADEIGQYIIQQRADDISKQQMKEINERVRLMTKVEKENAIEGELFEIQQRVKRNEPDNKADLFEIEWAYTDGYSSTKRQVPYQLQRIPGKYQSWPDQFVSEGGFTANFLRQVLKGAVDAKIEIALKIALATSKSDRNTQSALDRTTAVQPVALKALNISRSNQYIKDELLPRLTEIENKISPKIAAWRKGLAKVECAAFVELLMDNNYFHSQFRLKAKSKNRAGFAMDRYAADIKNSLLTSQKEDRTKHVALLKKHFK